MAVAKQVVDVERTNGDWIDVDDLNGNRYRYVASENEVGDSPHIVAELLPNGAIRTVLARDEKGVALLRQDEDGLPSRVVVSYPSGIHMGIATMSHWIGNREYLLKV